MKRVTLVKDPQKGIGCTIKNAAGHILVNRIIEDGPIAITGVLRPGNLLLPSTIVTHTYVCIQAHMYVIRTHTHVGVNKLTFTLSR